MPPAPDDTDGSRPAPAAPPRAAGAAVDKGVLALAWPLVVSFTLRTTFTWVDRFYAGALEGLEDASQAAIGLTQPLEFLMIACWVGTSNAVTSRWSAAMGAGEGRRIAQLRAATTRIVWVLIALFVALAVGIWFTAPHLGLAPEVAQQFRLYAAVMLGGGALTRFWSILPDSIVKAHHDTKTTMWAGIVSSLLNVALNTLFVFVFHWGIVGIAASTAVGALGGLVYAQWRAAQHERRREVEGGYETPGVYTRPVRALLAIALPAGLTFVFMAIEGLAVNGVLANTAGTAAEQKDALAAWSIFDNAVRFAVMPVIATGVALLPLGARLWARGDFAGVRRELRTALLALVVYTVVVVTPAVWFGGDWLVSMLLGSESARTDALLGVWLIPFAAMAVGPLFLVRPLFDAVDRAMTGLAYSAVRSLGLVVPGLLAGGLIASRLGADPMLGYYLGFGAGGAAGSALVLWGFRRVWRGAARPATSG